MRSLPSEGFKQRRWVRTCMHRLSVLLIIAILSNSLPVEQAQALPPTSPLSSTSTLVSSMLNKIDATLSNAHFTSTPSLRPQQASTQQTVTISDNGFAPATLTLSVGDQVTWVNQGTRNYSVRLDTQLFDLFLPIITGGQTKQQQSVTPTSVPQATDAHTSFWESNPIPPNQSATLVFTQTGSLHMRLFTQDLISGAIQFISARGKIEVTAANQVPMVSLTATPTSGTAPLTVSFTAIASDVDNDALTYRWLFGDGASAGDSATISHRYDQPGSYTATVTVSDGVASVSARQAIVVAAPIDGLPPDPATVAPALDRSVVTDISGAAEFLYTGDNPIQTGVLPGTIEVTRTAVLRGKVLDHSGQPLPGATITILGQPNYGQTLSRADGMFDMVVNGGGPLTVNYALDGYLTAQRQVEVPIRDYLWLPDVALIERDTQATTVDLTAATPMQIARGSLVSDAEGVRQATLLIPQGVTATLVLSDGTLRPLTSLKVRATEYTVGSGGPQAMPGQLPPTSGYTYALEYSVDEADAAGAVDVRFSKPLYHYVENFLGFPVGSAAPVGYYDRVQGRWVASQNGRVVKVITVTDGIADLDTTGDDVADNDPALGITEAERRQVATLYTANTTLWRVPITHFTPWDINWPYGPPEDAIPPNGNDPERDIPDDDPDTICSSIIECQNQILGEAVTVVGTPFRLHYASDRTPARAANRTLVIPLSGATVPASLTGIDLEISIAGQLIKHSVAPAPNLRYTFPWDGNDGYGRPIQGVHPVTVRIRFRYNGQYYGVASEFEASFVRVRGSAGGGSGGGAIYSGPMRAAQQIVLERTWVGALGVLDIRAQGLGAWSFSVHHTYDPLGRVLYMGDGSRRLADALPSVITTVAGKGTSGSSNDGIPAIQANIDRPYDIAVGPDGSLYIATYNIDSNHRVRRVNPDGIITTVAGQGNRGFSGDGGPALLARLNQPTGIAIAPDGSLYIADSGNSRIRRVGPDGIIATVAGRGNMASTGDGGLATLADLNRPTGIALGPDGSLYIADSGNYRIRQVGTDGIITTVAGNGDDGSGGDGALAITATIRPHSVFVGQDGSLYIADTTNNRVRRVGPDGIITTVAGSSLTSGYAGDGGLAAQARFGFVYDIEVTPNGILYLTDPNNWRVRRVGTNGIVTTVAGNGSRAERAADGDGGPATQAALHTPRYVVVAPDNSLYLVDWYHSRVRRVSAALPGYNVDDVIISAEDGSKIYIFDATGRHRQTLDGLTSAVRYTFSYDSAGRLATVTDGDGNVTRLERNGNGQPTAIVGPYGQRTALTLDDNGYLATIANPAGETVRLTHTATGLLTAFTNPRGNSTQFAYDAQGYLLQDTNAAGGFHKLARTELDLGHQVERTTAAGYKTLYQTEYLATGDQEKINTFPDGTQRQTTTRVNGQTIERLADGTTVTLQEGPDPRFGMQAPLAAGLTITTPGGLSLLATAQSTVTLADATNPLSLTQTVDTVAINGRTYVSTFAAANRTITSRTPQGRQSVITLDEQGRPVLEQVPGIDPVSYSYDARGRLTSATQGSGLNARTVTLGYDNNGYFERVTDPLGRVASFVYDAAGRVTRQTLPDGRTIAYGYDANGNLVSLTPPGRPAHTFSYTATDLPASYTAPAVGEASAQTTYGYNTDKQLTQLTRPDGKSLVLDYDAAGRLDTLTIARGALQYAYHPTTGNLATITAPDGGALSYAYDGGLLTGESWTGLVAGSVGYTYDNDFRVSTIRVNGANPIVYQYDGDSLLTAAGALTLARDAQIGRLTGSTLGNVTDSWRYNSFGEPTGYSVTTGGNPLYSFSHTYDALGRISRKSETFGAKTVVYDYTYDLVGRLAAVAVDGAVISSYTYDSNSNRLSATTVNGTVAGTYDDQDRLLTYGEASYTYTANGELTSKTANGQTTSYIYDELGNLLAVTLPNGTQIDYVIDGQNRRIGKRVNGTLVQGFLYDGQLAPVAELDGSGNIVSRFIYATHVNVPDYMVRNGVTYRIITDHLGSPRLVIDTTTGVIVQRMDFDAWGNVQQDTNPGFHPFGFAGGLYDRETGFVRFGERDYNPIIGRWTTKDPIGFAGDALDLYSYVGGDPISYSDPYGLEEESWIDRLLGWYDHYSKIKDVKEEVDKISERAKQLQEAEDDYDRVKVGLKFLTDQLSRVPVFGDFYSEASEKTVDVGIDAIERSADRFEEALCDEGFSGRDLHDPGRLMNTPGGSLLKPIMDFLGF